MRAWMGLAALAGALACGSSEKAAPECAPSDCSTLGATCGAAGDGCGGVIECGACASGETCGGGGTANVCGTGTCQPATCQAKGATCGTVPDGCGGLIACGDCPAGESCGAGGTPNVCGEAPACERTTCQAKGATCGTVADGCGGELACGECQPGDACGAAGTPNACAPIPPTGEVAWSFAVSSPGPDYPIGAGSDASGNRYLLSFTWNEVGAVHTLRLQKLAPDGKLTFTKEWGTEGLLPWDRQIHMAVTPLGNVFLAWSAPCTPGACFSRLDLGGGATADAALVKLGPDGGFVWQRELTGSAVTSLGTNDQGSALVARRSRTDGATRIEKYQHDGALLRAVVAEAQVVALDPAGNMIALDYGWARKYAPDGKLLWGKQLSGAGFPLGAATTAKGTVVLLANRAGDVEFGPSRVRSGELVLYVLEADARPRFARGLPWSGTPFLAVDPTGRAAVVGSGSCGEIAVEAFDLSDADLWRRFLPDAARCWAGMAAGPAAYGADHRLFLSGAFSIAVEIGGTTLTPRGLDVVGVLLDP